MADEHAAKVMALVEKVPVKEAYADEDIGALFDENFRAAFTIAQLFLGISKDEFQDRLGAILGPRNIGSKSFASRRAAYIAALGDIELPAAMATAVNFKPVWSDILIERLRSGRGKAIKGRKSPAGGRKSKLPKTPFCMHSPWIYPDRMSTGLKVAYLWHDSDVIEV